MAWGSSWLGWWLAGLGFGNDGGRWCLAGGARVLGCYVWREWTGTRSTHIPAIHTEKQAQPAVCSLCAYGVHHASILAAKHTADYHTTPHPPPYSTPDHTPTYHTYLKLGDQLQVRHPGRLVGPLPHLAHDLTQRAGPAGGVLQGSGAGGGRQEDGGVGQMVHGGAGQAGTSDGRTGGQARGRAMRRQAGSTQVHARAGGQAGRQARREAKQCVPPGSACAACRPRRSRQRRAAGAMRATGRTSAQSPRSSGPQWRRRSCAQQAVEAGRT